MGKGARNRHLRKLAESVTVGYDEGATKSVARSLRKQAGVLRRRGIHWRGDVRVIE